MSEIYTEATFEAAIEDHLIKKGGYISGNPETQHLYKVNRLAGAFRLFHGSIPIYHEN